MPPIFLQNCLAIDSLRECRLFPPLERQCGSDGAGEISPDFLKGLADFIPSSALRRIPRLGRLALKAGLEVKSGESGTGCALIMGTALGSAVSTLSFLDSILNDGAAASSPTAFSHSVTNMAAAIVSQHLGISGPCLTITQPAPLAAALELSFCLINNRRAEKVLLGFVEENCPQLTELENIISLPSPTAEAVAFFLFSGNSDTEHSIKMSLENNLSNSADETADSPPALALALACCRFSGGRLETKCLSAAPGLAITLQKNGG